MKQRKLTVKSSEEEMDNWKEAAYIRKTSLSEWVRRVLNANAETTRKKGAG